MVKNLTVDLFTIKNVHIAIHQSQLQNGNARKTVVAELIKVVALIVLIITARVKQIRITSGTSMKLVLNMGLNTYNHKMISKYQ